MLIALIVALVAINFGYLIAGDRKDKRVHDDREREYSERADLLQRIQAPQAAVIAHHAAAVPPAPDGDGMPMTDEEIAERQAHADAISLIESVENGRLALLDIGATE